MPRIAKSVDQELADDNTQVSRVTPTHVWVTIGDWNDHLGVMDVDELQLGKELDVGDKLCGTNVLRLPNGSPVRRQDGTYVLTKDDFLRSTGGKYRSLTRRAQRGGGARAVPTRADERAPRTSGRRSVKR
jgi:hypothetical protein